MEGFLKFIREQGVIGLAIGFMMGGAVSKVVSAFVQDIVNPIVSGLFKNLESLETASINIGSVQIMWGDFVVVMIDFFIIAAVIYFIFKGLGLEKLDKKKEKKA